MRKSLTVLFNGEKLAFTEGECGVRAIKPSYDAPPSKHERTSVKVYMGDGTVVTYGNTPFQLIESRSAINNVFFEDNPF